MRFLAYVAWAASGAVMVGIDAVQFDDPRSWVKFLGLIVFNVAGIVRAYLDQSLSIPQINHQFKPPSQS